MFFCHKRKVFAEMFVSLKTELSQLLLGYLFRQLGIQTLHLALWMCQTTGLYTTQVDSVAFLEPPLLVVIFADFLPMLFAC